MRRILTVILLLAGLLVLGLSVACNRSGPAQESDGDWSANVLLGNGVQPSEIGYIEAFQDPKKEERQLSPEELSKTKIVLKAVTSDKVEAFLRAARAQPERPPWIDTVDLQKPKQLYHIFIANSDGEHHGYGWLLVFEKDGAEFGMVKADDGTGTYIYNLDLVKLIENSGTN